MTLGLPASGRVRPDATSDVTELLVRWNDGDKHALDELLPLVYAELRRVAGGYLKHERPDHSLQATAVVHDVYLRLVDHQASARSRSRLADHQFGCGFGFLLYG